jgi:hypothetical protein
MIANRISCYHGPLHRSSSKGKHCSSLVENVLNINIEQRFLGDNWCSCWNLYYSFLLFANLMLCSLVPASILNAGLFKVHLSSFFWMKLRKLEVKRIKPGEPVPETMHRHILWWVICDYGCFSFSLVSHL